MEYDSLWQLPPRGFLMLARGLSVTLLVFVAWE